MKRIIDIMASLFFLILFSPIIILTAIISFFVHGRKILFIQERIGRNCKKFNVIKFRTMTDERDQNGELLSDDDRQTSFGKFMRDYSLDELLQFINILKGDMSLVGPRPLMEKYIKNCNEIQLKRHDVRPGITGLAQVCGRNSISYDARFKYDLLYVKNARLLLDIRIIFMTVLVVLGRRNVTYNPEIERAYYPTAQHGMVTK